MKTERKPITWIRLGGFQPVKPTACFKRISSYEVFNQLFNDRMAYLNWLHGAPPYLQMTRVEGAHYSSTPSPGGWYPKSRGRLIAPRFQTNHINSVRLDTLIITQYSTSCSVIVPILLNQKMKSRTLRDGFIRKKLIRA